MKTNNIFSLLFLLAAFLFAVSSDCMAREACPNGSYEYTDPESGELKCQEDQVGEEGKDRGCTDLNTRLNETKKCIFCPLFKVLYDAAHTMAQTATDKTAIPIRNVLIVGFAVYIAFSALGYVSSFTKQDAPKYLTGLLAMAFKVLIAFLLLSNVAELYTLFINPLLMAGLDFGGNLLFANGAANLAACKAQASGSMEGILPAGLYQGLECYIKAIQEEIAFAQAAGGAIWCFGMKELSSLNMGSGFGLLGQGAVVYLCALLLSLAFAFYLIDTVVQLGIFGALLCFLIACWPFKITAGYSKAGLQLLMNAFFVFIFMGVVVSINVALITESLATGGLGGLEEALNQNNIDVVKEILDWSFGGFLILLCCTIFGFKFCAQASVLAGQFAGGGGAEIGRNIGGMIASPIVRGGKKIGKTAMAPITSAASRQVSKAYDGVKYAVSHPIRTGRSAFQGIKSRAKNAAAFAKLTPTQRALGMNNWGNPASQDQSGANDSTGQKPTTTNQNQFAGGSNPANLPNAQAQNQQGGGNSPETNANAQSSSRQSSGGGNRSNAEILAEARRLQQEALEAYEKAKGEKAQAAAFYNEIAEKTAQAQQEVNMAQAALEQARGTPQEIAAQTALDQAQSKFEGLQSQKDDAEANVMLSQQKMNRQAVSYHVNSQKAAAYAAGNGHTFDEAKAAADASANNLGRITEEMDKVLNAQPRPDNAGANPENIGGAGQSGDVSLDSVAPGSGGDSSEAAQATQDVQKSEEEIQRNNEEIKQALEEQKRLYEETKAADEAASQKIAKAESEMKEIQEEINRLNGGSSQTGGGDISDRLTSLKNEQERLRGEIYSAQAERSQLRDKLSQFDRQIKRQEEELRAARSGGKPMNQQQPKKG